MKDSGKKLRLFSASVRFYCLLLVIIFIGELFVMFILPFLLPGAERIVENFADSFLLTIVLAPFLWVLITQRMEAEEKIRNLNTELLLNIDKLKKTREEFVRRERLATIGQVADNMGRELRNTLGGVSNAVYFLKSRMSEADEDVKEYLEIIRREVENSVRLIASLFDYAWPREPFRTPVMVNELVDESLGNCQIPENIAVNVDIPGALPQIGVDRTQVNQVLQNLVTNAVQAMPKGGALAVSARSHPSLEFIEISVADTGEGISPENMEKIFQPLFTNKARGIGLGLAICKSLAEANGGRIEVESELGKGTMLKVVLPVV